MHTLVLAEKPSVARDIARVLGARDKGENCLIGKDYVVTWALGHLVTLKEPQELATGAARRSRACRPD